MFTSASAFDSLPGGAMTKEKHQLRFTHDVLRTTVELARKARDDYWAKAQMNDTSRLRPLVAASVGPAGDTVLWTGATDANTSVHNLPDAFVSQYYSRKIASLAASKPDLIALETLPGVREARLALQALSDVAPSLPAWVSFICRSDDSTAAGDAIGEAVFEMGSHPQVVACGLNCTSPSHVRGLLERARATAGPQAVLLAYPNSGERWDAREGARCWHHGGDEAGGGANAAAAEVVLDGEYAVAMRSWGADLIGGCCRVHAEQIAEFRAALLPARGLR